MTCCVAIKIFRSESKKTNGGRRKHFSEGKGTSSLDIAKSKKIPQHILYKGGEFLRFCEFLICYCIFSREPHSTIFIFVRWTFVRRLCGIGSVFEKSVYSIVFLIKYRSENHINTPEKQSSKEKCSLGFIRQTPVLTADV